MSLLGGIFVALLWGCTDILISYASRTQGPLQTTLISQTSGQITLALVALGFFWLWAPARGLFFASHLSSLPLYLVLSVVLGFLNTVSYFALSYALGRGPIALVSPIIAAEGAVTMIAAILFLGERIKSSDAILLVIILLGVILSTFVPPSGSDKDSSHREQKQRASFPLEFLQRVKQHLAGTICAVVAMFGLGLLSFGIGAITAVDGIMGAFLIIFCLRFSSLIFLVVIVSVRKPAAGQDRPTPLSAWLFAILAGMVQMAGWVLFSLTILVSSTALAGVLSSAAPLLPLLYGLVVRHERPSSLQFTGVIWVILGLILLPLSLTVWMSIGINVAVTSLLMLFFLIMKPKDRYQCVSEFANKLRRVMNELPTPSLPARVNPHSTQPDSPMFYQILQVTRENAQQAMPQQTSITITCPRCHSSVALPHHILAGRTAYCPQCGTSLRDLLIDLSKVRR